MLQENTKNRMDTESKERRFIWSNTAKGQYHAETDTQKTRTVWTHNVTIIEQSRICYKTRAYAKHGRPIIYGWSLRNVAYGELPYATMKIRKHHRMKNE